MFVIGGDSDKEEEEEQHLHPDADRCCPDPSQEEEPLGFLSLLDASTAGSAQSLDQLEEIEFTADSGACVTIAPESACPDYPVIATAESLAGRASGPIEAAARTAYNDARARVARQLDRAVALRSHASIVSDLAALRAELNQEGTKVKVELQQSGSMDKRLSHPHDADVLHVSGDVARPAEETEKEFNAFLKQSAENTASAYAMLYIFAFSIRASMSFAGVPPGSNP